MEPWAGRNKEELTGGTGFYEFNQQALAAAGYFGFERTDHSGAGLL